MSTETHSEMQPSNQVADNEKQYLRQLGFPDEPGFWWNIEEQCMVFFGRFQEGFPLCSRSRENPSKLIIWPRLAMPLWYGPFTLPEKFKSSFPLPIPPNA